MFCERHHLALEEAFLALRDSCNTYPTIVPNWFTSHCDYFAMSTWTAERVDALLSKLYLPLSRVEAAGLMVYRRTTRVGLGL